MMWTDEQVRRAVRAPEDGASRGETGVLGALFAVSLVAILLILGNLDTDHTEVLRHRCDRHGGIHQAAVDEGRIISVTCEDGEQYSQ
jgi:Flp pilus assembly pilin Flp